MGWAEIYIGRESAQGVQHTAPAASWEGGREELRESKLLLLGAGEVLASLRDPGIWYVNTLEPLQDKAKEVI